MKPAIRPAVAGVLAAQTPSTTLIAREEPIEWFRHTMENAWLTPFDPTLIDRWVSAELSYEEDRGGASTIEFKSSFRDAFHLHNGIGLGYQLQVPLKQNDDGNSHVSGLGDFEARVGLVGRFLPTLRWGAGVNAKFDSASDPALGDQAFQLKSIFILRWDTTDRITLGIDAEYTFTPSDAGIYDVRTLELKFPFAVRLSGQWAAGITYKPEWNFLTDDLEHTMDLGSSYTFGHDRHYVLSFGLELPLSEQDLEWKVSSGFTWHF
ncbi:hypothetical protein [Haloferula sp.]|uniref:hypothetical protein n=1 Tax=Haloferula sp. TaxID=2497595 RepID=UPI003C793927